MYDQMNVSRSEDRDHNVSSINLLAHDAPKRAKHYSFVFSLQPETSE